jgi:adenylate cyclase
MRRRDLAVAALIVAVATGLTQVPGARFIDGLSIDALFWLRAAAFAPRYAPEDSPTTIVAIDEETYRTPPFQDKPQALWTPDIAAVLRALLAADAKVVGFDVIFPTSLEPVLPGFDREFLLALREGSRDGRVVLTKVQHQALPIRPFPSQSLVVGNERNIRSANLFQEPDDVIRRAPLLLDAEDLVTGERREPSLSLELAARSAGVAVRAQDGGVAFGDRMLPDSATNNLLINFAPGNSIPSYSLADLHACAAAGRSDYFAAHFKGKVVLIGTVLDLEDRKLTSKRLINREQPTTSPDRCALASRPELMRSDIERADLPGVYIHAAAVNTLLRGDLLRMPTLLLRVLFILGLTSATVASLLLLPIARGAIAAGTILLLGVAAAVILFQQGWVVPMLPALLAGTIGGSTMVAYRVAIGDRDKRRLQRVFGLYLAPAVVERLAAKDEMPALGGERREMTFLFSDIADFTTLSERTDPAVLAEAINAYLEGVCEAVMGHGGMVTDFAGDGVFAMFGAPLWQANHAERAIACAADLARFSESFRAEQQKKGMAFGHTRVGLHTGSALVGNFGSRKRLKYSALGDAVNTASRIEGLNKYFGTRVAASKNAIAGQEDRFRPLGEFILKGKSEGLAIYELLTPERATSPYVARYRAAYQALAEGDEAALGLFEALAAEDPQDGPVAFHLKRLKSGLRSPLIRMDEK